MGSGSFAISSFVIGYDHLKKIVPGEISAIENEKFFGDIGWGTIGHGLEDVPNLEEVKNTIENFLSTNKYYYLGQ